MTLSQQKWLELHGQITTVIQLPGNSWWDRWDFHTILKQIFKWRNLIQWNCNWAWVGVAQIIYQRERFCWWWETPGRGCLVHTGGFRPYWTLLHHRCLTFKPYSLNSVQTMITLGKNFVSYGHICTTYWSTLSKLVNLWFKTMLKSLDLYMD